MSSVARLPTAAPAPDQKIPEQEVVRHRPLLALAVLRRARAAKKIKWYIGPKRSAWYTLSDVDAFIERERCRNPEAESSSSLGGNGSPESTEGDVSTVTGLSPELESQTAEALARMI